MNNISLIETEELNTKIQIILRQTDYTLDTAILQLKKHNYNEVLVIKKYLGIPDKIEENKIVSLNQEIYKQLRYKLNSNMEDYNNIVQKGLVSKIV